MDGTDMHWVVGGIGGVIGGIIGPILTALLGYLIKSKQVSAAVAKDNFQIRQATITQQQADLFTESKHMRDEVMKDNLEIRTKMAAIQEAHLHCLTESADLKVKIAENFVKIHELEAVINNHGLQITSLKSGNGATKH